MLPVTPRRRPFALALATAALVAAGITCRASKPPEDLQHPPQDPRDPRDYRTPLPMPVPPTQAPQQPDPPHPALDELPPRTGAAGSTRGSIACGAGRCYAPREACTWLVRAAAWGCVPPGEVNGNMLVSYACDDPSDCSEGTSCCRTLDEGYDYVRCAAPGEDCGARVCAGEEGGLCPVGQACRNGECTPEKPPPATCDGKKPCPADKPICFWQDTEGECVSEERAKEIVATRDGEAGISLRRCTRPADCAAGFACCGKMDHGLWMSVCALQCDPYIKKDFCETDADCVAVDDTPLQCRKARQVGQAEVPPWSKRCGADAQPVPPNAGPALPKPPFLPRKPQQSAPPKPPSTPPKAAPAPPKTPAAPLKAAPTPPKTPAAPPKAPK